MLMLSGVLGSILSKLHIYYFGYFNRKEFINTEEALAVKKITLLAIMVFVKKRY